METAEQNQTRDSAKKIAVFDVAADVFARYGFRRTTMNDLAEAAGISRPALYLMFENKEHLFIELVSYRVDEAISAATEALMAEGPIKDRILAAVLVFESSFYETIADSPHGAELMDTSKDLKNDHIVKGLDRFKGKLASQLRASDKLGEVDFSESPVKPAELVELLFTAIGGVKKNASSGLEFRKQVQQVTEIFLHTISG